MKRYKEREPIPFYFLNDTFNAEEIKIQLDFMRDTGVGAFFLHVRDGILDEAYGTETYFKRVKFIVEQAAERKIKVWLYDEDSFPSGNAGGQIAIESPELQAYSRRNKRRNGKKSFRSGKRFVRLRRKKRKRS